MNGEFLTPAEIARKLKVQPPWVRVEFAGRPGVLAVRRRKNTLMRIPVAIFEAWLAENSRGWTEPKLSWGRRRAKQCSRTKS